MFFTFLTLLLLGSLVFSKSNSSKNEAKYGLPKSMDEYHEQQRIKYLKKIGHSYELLSFEERIKNGALEYYNFVSTIEGVTFSGQFTSNMILQREPLYAKIYGAADTSDTLIIITLNDLENNREYIFETYSQKASNAWTTNNWEVLLPQTFPNGGNFTLTAECLECITPNNVTLYNITFGDVFYCSGQSNMELDMHYTFSRNDSYDNISAGKYKNIRYQTYNGYLNENITYVLPPNTNPAWQWVNEPDNDTLDSFSATCWYFAQSLYDIFDVKDINIGLIDVAVGGTMIEQWTQNETVQLACKETLCPDPLCGSMYNTLTAGFLNMTIKAILWYQGENNMGETHGSWLNSTGYGCMEPFMVNQWRSQWDILGNSDIPFGLVELASGTDEGHPDMGSFRWAQLNNLGYMNNYIISNSFAANAYDLGDPWAKNCYYEDPSPCLGYDKPYNWNATNYYMGPIHPRAKIWVGQRLAQAGYDILYNNGEMNYIRTGPLLKTCWLNKTEKSIHILYNETYLMGREVKFIEPYFWYNESIINTISNWSAIEINIGKEWFITDINSDLPKQYNEMIVDISNFNNSIDEIVGIRYAWGDTNQCGKCCGTLDLNYNPCPPGSCPIKIMDPNTGIYMPAVPFWAQINQTTSMCECFAPQEC